MTLSRSEGNSVRALGMYRFGGPEVLEVVKRPFSSPTDEEVRIRVAAAPVNPADTLFRSGQYADQLAAWAPPYVCGMELAGIVDAAGSDADVPIGARVMAITLPVRRQGGAQAEYVVVPAGSVAEIPDNLSLELASTVPMNGLTALLAIRNLAVRPGQVLAITGAAGAVGGYAIELGKAAGARVIADASPADTNLVRSLGADHVVTRGPTFAQSVRSLVPAGADALVDAALLQDEALPAVRDGGRIAALRAFDWIPERDIEARLVAVPELARDRDALGDLARRAANGGLSPRICATYAPERAAEAHRRLEAGGVRGRLLISFDSPATAAWDPKSEGASHK